MTVVAGPAVEMQVRLNTGTSAVGVDRRLNLSVLSVIVTLPEEQSLFGMDIWVNVVN